MLDFYYPYTEEKWDGALKLEKLTENNNLIVYCDSSDALQALCIPLSKCNKIYINPFNDINRLELPPQPYPDSKPTYLFIFPCNRIKNLPFPKIITGELWENKYEVYDLNIRNKKQNN